MNPDDGFRRGVYREDVYTDRKWHDPLPDAGQAATARRTPGAVRFTSGEAQILTPMGAIPADFRGSNATD